MFRVQPLVKTTLTLSLITACNPAPTPTDGTITNVIQLPPEEGSLSRHSGVSQMQAQRSSRPAGLTISSLRPELAQALCQPGELPRSRDLGQVRREYRQMIETWFSLKGILTRPAQALDSTGREIAQQREPSQLDRLLTLPAAAPTAFNTPMPGSTSTPTASSAPTATPTQDISVVEKTTFNGKIFDSTGAPLDGVTVKARSLSSGIPYEETSTTSGGAFFFNNAPSGISIEIIATKPGLGTRRRVEVLKSNKQGDPNANKYDFGAGVGSNGTIANALSDKPEVSGIKLLRPFTSADAPVEGLRLLFNEPMDTSSVESAISIMAPDATAPDGKRLVSDRSAFKFEWNQDHTLVTLTLLSGQWSADEAKDYEIGFNKGLIKDKSGISRDSDFFKVTEGDYEAFLYLKSYIDPNSGRMQIASLPQPGPTPLPPPAKERDFFYFSYDDSASTAAADLVRNSLKQGLAISQNLARPWEFLNSEQFENRNQEPTGLFNVSMGLWQHRDASRPHLDTYELGVHVTAPDLCRARRKPMHITLVIDVSGSMSGPAYKQPFAHGPGQHVPTRLDLVKAGLVKMLDNLKDGDRVSLVRFAGDARVLLDNHLFHSGDSTLSNAIASLVPDGGTNLNAGLQLGYQLANEHYAGDRSNRLLLLTDAHANIGEIDPGVVSRHTQLNNQEGIYFSALGYGTDYNEAFLNQLAEAGKGAYYAILTQRDAQRAFGERFLALTHVAARDVRFKLEFPAYLRHGQSAAEQVSTIAAQVQPTNFSFNTSQYFLEQFQANPGDDVRDQLIRLSISYKNPVTGVALQEVYEKPIGELLGQDRDNIRTAHMVQLLPALIAGQVSPDAAQQEISLIGD